MTEPISRAVKVGEFYELEVGADLAASSRFNEDIAPTRIAQRTWNEWHIAALWVGMAICVPTYTLGGVLTTYFGLSVGEALWLDRVVLAESAKPPRPAKPARKSAPAPVPVPV